MSSNCNCCACDERLSALEAKLDHLQRTHCPSACQRGQPQEQNDRGLLDNIDLPQPIDDALEALEAAVNEAKADLARLQQQAADAIQRAVAKLQSLLDRERSSHAKK